MMWTDNPVQDAEDYAAEGEKKRMLWLSCNAECIECGRTITTEMCVVLDSREPMETAVCVNCERKAVEAVKAAGLKELAWWLHDYLTDCRMDTPRDFDKAVYYGFNE